MCGAVKAALELDFPGKDGTTERQHLLQVYEQTGRWDERLDTVEVPAEGARVWTIFWSIRRDLSITLLEIEAYCRLTGTRLAPWEVGAIRSMDAVIAAHVAAQVKRPTGGDGG